MISDLQKSQYQFPGSQGLPEAYPKPPVSDKLLFYIQRNHNMNTVVYEMNELNTGGINNNFPMHAYWLKYSTGGEIQELNFYQSKLAYGYESKMINPDSFEFNFVSYKELKLFIAKDSTGKFRAYCNINEYMSILNNIYVYAVELGVFPTVKFIELYGSHCQSGLPAYQRINIDQ